MVKEAVPNASVVAEVVVPLPERIMFWPAAEGDSVATRVAVVPGSTVAGPVRVSDAVGTLTVDDTVSRGPDPAKEAVSVDPGCWDGTDMVTIPALFVVPDPSGPTPVTVMGWPATGAPLEPKTTVSCVGEDIVTLSVGVVYPL